MTVATTAGWILAAYLAGSIPFAWLFARAKGVDIRRAGSGNVGATNVFRSVGPAWGVATLVGDALKGFLPAWAFPRLAAGLAGASAATWPHLGLFCGVAAVAGHTWPVTLRFRGGKGVATSLGALLGVAPAAAGLGVAVWVALFAVLRYVSVASIGAAVAIPVAAWTLAAARPGFDPVLPLVLTALGLLVVVRHRSNMVRLWAGTENRAGRRTAGGRVRATGDTRP